MKKFLQGSIIVLLVITVLSYFGVQWIEDHHEEHFAYLTNYWGNNNAPDDSINADADTDFTFVINYYANEDNSGAEMFELKVNYYTDYLFQDIYSLGVQVINPNEMDLTIKREGEDNPVFGDYHAYYKYDVNYSDTSRTYFQTDDGVSFKAQTTFNEKEEPYIIKIDDKPYAFDFNKEFEAEKYSQFLWRGSYRHYSSSFSYFLYKVYDATSHIVDGDGVYKNLKLELADVFNFYEYNPVTGKFDIQSTFGYDVNYVSFKINYHSRGAKVHEDSLFNQIGSETPGGVIWKNS